MQQTSTKYPETVEEFMLSKWFPKIGTIIRSFHLNEPPEDTIQDVLCSMVQKNYVARWDPALGGSFANWIYTFVINMCRQKYNRSNSRGGRRIERALSIEQTFDEESQPLGDMLPGPPVSPEFSIKIDEVRRVLRQPEFKHHSVHECGGIIYTRCPATIFDLILAGLSQTDIAERLGTSKTYIYSQMKRIRPVVSEIFG